MGLKFTREYDEIIDDFAEGIKNFNNFYEFLNMDENIWNEMPQEQQQEIIKTLADDLFYALGNDKIIDLGSDIIKYLSYENCIVISNSRNEVFRINLDSNLIN